jgi:2',3'-cyclic-nucleotide 2'-phosphodiesterase (5'-nucleotidase family)
MRYKGEASAGDGKPLPVEPYIVRILPSGIRVGIVGATVPMVTERMSARHVSAFLFDDPVGEIRRIAAALRPDVDLLIALTHIGIKADELLAQSCPDLDLLVTGHTHLVVRSGDRLEGAPIVQAGWFARFLGKVVFEAGAGRARIVESEIVPLEPANR